MRRLRSGLVGLWLACVACSSGGRHAPNDGIDEPVHTREPQSGSSRADSGITAGSSDAGRSNDASAAAGNDGGTATMAPATAEPELEAGTTVGTTLDDASLIIEPEIGAVNVPELCKSLWRLQGRVIETDLSGQVTLGPWSAVSNFLATSGTALDASVANDTAESDAGDRDSGRSDEGRSDAGRSDTGRSDTGDRDAATCADKFAPYIIACEQGVIVLQSPDLVYEAGPQLGGEVVNMGCWERQCTVDCVPRTAEQLQTVRARVNPVVPTTTPDGGQGAAGFVRVNGVDVEAIATLDITSRL